MSVHPDPKQVPEETVEEMVAWLKERGISVSFTGRAASIQPSPESGCEHCKGTRSDPENRGWEIRPGGRWKPCPMCKPQPESGSGEEGERAERFDLPERLRTDDLGADLADELRTRATHLREAAPEEGPEQAQCYEQAGMLDEAAEVVEWAGDRRDTPTPTPTQPLQGSEVERYRLALNKGEMRVDPEGPYVRFADHSALAQEHAATLSDRHARAAEAARERSTVESLEEDLQLVAEAVEREAERATQAEARIQEAMEEFEERAALGAGDVESEAAIHTMLLRAAVYKDAAFFLRSQPSSEVGEGPVEDCDDLCACGHERFAHMVNETESGSCAEGGCSCKGFSPGCPDCKQEEGDEKQVWIALDPDCIHGENVREFYPEAVGMATTALEAMLTPGRDRRDADILASCVVSEAFMALVAVEQAASSSNPKENPDA